MATETEAKQPAGRKRPSGSKAANGNGAKAAAPAAAKPAKADKTKPTYHVYDAEKLAAARVGQVVGRTAEHALAVFFQSEDNSGLVGKELVLVPERNTSRLSAQVENKPRVVVKTA